MKMSALAMRRRAEGMTAQQKAALRGGFFFEGFGGARRDRTADLLHAMQALSQLSYGPLPFLPTFKGPSRRKAALPLEDGNGAARGIRTLDPNLGKVVLYP